MKIRVKHNNTEVIVEDDAPRTDTNNNLIHYNKDYIIALIKEIAQQIIKIKNESNIGI